MNSSLTQKNTMPPKPQPHHINHPNHINHLNKIQLQSSRNPSSPYPYPSPYPQASSTIKSTRSWTSIKTRLKKQKQEKIRVFQELVKNRRKQDLEQELAGVDVFVYRALVQVDQRVCRDLCMRKFQFGKHSGSITSSVRTCRVKYIR